MKSDTKFLLILLGVVLLAVLGPIAIIWSINTLFPTAAIGYTIETWLAAAVLSGAISVRRK